MTTADGYDVIVIGGGHNGLVTAAYLGRAGRRVLVLERRPFVGGAAVTEDIVPGFRAPTGASLVGLLRPEVMYDLDLVRHGLAFLPFDPTVVGLGEDGRSLRLWRDGRRSKEEIASYSRKDAEAYPHFHQTMVQLGRVVDPLLVTTPPSLASASAREQWFLLRRALKVRRLGKDAMHEALRFPTMSLADFLAEWFETELLKATIAMDGLLGTFRGPRSPGTAFGLLHHYLAEANGGAWALVRGGTGTLPDALASAAQAYGVSIRTDAAVKRILTSDGRVTGVELLSAETIAANVVASNADPKATLLGLVDSTELDPRFLLQIKNYNTAGATSKVNLALEGLPSLPRVDGGMAPVHLRIGPSLEYLERAYDDGKYGRRSKELFLDVVVPTVVDPSLAPSGKHVMSIVAQYTPYGLKRGSWQDAREDLGDAVVETLEEFLPGIRRMIVGRQVLTPWDLEQRFGMTGGHIYHGEMTLDQQYVLRPAWGWARYRTPIAGLYLCGSGTHPGGGITGAPGYNAAREILKDLRRRRA